VIVGLGVGFIVFALCVGCGRRQILIFMLLIMVLVVIFVVSWVQDDFFGDDLFNLMVFCVVGIEGGFDVWWEYLWFGVGLCWWIVGLEFGF